MLVTNHVIAQEKVKVTDDKTKVKTDTSVVKVKDDKTKIKDSDGKTKITDDKTKLKDGDDKTKVKDDKTKLKDSDGKTKITDDKTKLKDGDDKTKVKDDKTKIKDGDDKTKVKDDKTKIKDGDDKTKMKDDKIKIKDDGDDKTKVKDDKTKIKDGDDKTKMKDDKIKIKDDEGKVKVKGDDVIVTPNSYTPTYSSNYVIGNPAHSKMIVDLWKDWDDNAFDRHDYYADNLIMVLPDGTVTKGKAANLEAAKTFRSSLKSSKSTIDAWVPLKSTDRNENWVAMWGTETNTWPDGRVEMRDIHEIWRINEDGKVDLMRQFTAKHTPQ
jgi:hypothetical protein